MSDDWGSSDPISTNPHAQAAAKAQHKAQQQQAPAPGDQTTFAPLSPGSETRPRIAINLGPMVEGERRMNALEAGGKNPYTDHPITHMLEDSSDPGHRVLGMDLNDVGNQFASRDYQGYDQAAKGFESGFLPIMSGANVTPSEAQRQIRANIPRYGDSPEILAVKARNRKMMLNAAADLAGQPRPFPDAGTGSYAAMFRAGGAATSGDPNAHPQPPHDWHNGTDHSTANEGPLSSKTTPPVRGAVHGADGWHHEDPTKPGSWPRLGWNPAQAPPDHSGAFIITSDNRRAWID